MKLVCSLQIWREGMIHCLDFLVANGMEVVELITDSSSSVAKL